MAQQTKRAPGRPKKVQTEAAPKVVQELKTERPKASVKWKEKKEEGLRSYEYEIAREKKGKAIILKQNGVTVFDKESGKVELIRYCPNENSIYVKDQSEFAIVGAIIFRDGRLFVPADKPNLHRFLEAHPSNTKNGGTLFRLVDKQKDIDADLDKEFEMASVVSMIRDKDILDLIPVAIYFGVNTDAKSGEIRHNLLRIAKRDPGAFIASFDSPQVQARAEIQQAVDFQIISKRSNGAYWTDSNTLIVSTPAGMDTIDVMTRFCLTEKGSLVRERIKDELAKL